MENIQIPYILLQINNDETIFTTILNDESDHLNVHIIPVGFKQLSEQCFNTFPPTFDEMDNAINRVEEEVVKLNKQLNTQLNLLCADDDLITIARLAFNIVHNTDGTQTIARVELENLFTRLSEIIKGLPASQDVLPDDNNFAAYLLILREIMHHIGFEHIVLF